MQLDRCSLANGRLSEFLHIVSGVAIMTIDAVNLG